MISLVMLHWARPAYVTELLTKYSRYQKVSEVLLFANSPPPCLAAVHPAPTVIHATRDLGLYSRFAAAALASNPCILLVDDDLFVPEATLNSLFDYWSADAAVCHALQGRDVSDGYAPRDAFGQVEVVLTRCLMASRSLCIAALQHAHAFDDLHPEPQGNGEDILLSFTAMAESGRRNVAYRLPFENLPGYGEVEHNANTVAIHKRWPHHFDHRERLIERCRRHFVPHAHRPQHVSVACNGGRCCASTCAR